MLYSEIGKGLSMTALIGVKLDTIPGGVAIRNAFWVAGEWRDICIWAGHLDGFDEKQLQNIKEVASKIFEDLKRIRKDVDSNRVGIELRQDEKAKDVDVALVIAPEDKSALDCFPKNMQSTKPAESYAAKVDCHGNLTNCKPCPAKENEELFVVLKRCSDLYAAIIQARSITMAGVERSGERDNDAPKIKINSSQKIFLDRELEEWKLKKIEIQKELDESNRRLSDLKRDLESELKSLSRFEPKSVSAS